MTLAHRVWVASILALALVCVGLGRQLGIERAHTRLELDRIIDLQARMGSLQQTAPEGRPQARSAADGAPAQPVAARSATASTTAPVDPNVERQQRMQAMERVEAKLFADPESRRVMLAEAKIGVRQQYPGVARRLHLSAEQEDQLFELLAQQWMQGRDEYVRNRVAGKMPVYDVGDAEERQHAQEADLTVLLGKERFQQFETYQKSMPERRRVEAFQATLDEGDALHEEAAERLITALAGERERASTEAKSRAEGSDERGRTYMGFASGASVVLTDTDPTARLESATAQMESYDRRMEQVAAPILTSTQLKSFTQFYAERRRAQLADVQLMLMDRSGQRERGARH